VDPVPAHCYSENLAAPGIKPGTSGSAARKSDHQTTIIHKFKINEFYLKVISMEGIIHNELTH
jgi:hypothetical protein